MKTRSGFVSNSSSSSFVLMGTIVKDPKDLTLKDRIWVIGRYLYEGDDVFAVEDEKMLKFIKENYSRIEFAHDFKIYRNAWVKFDGVGQEFTREDMPEGKFTIISGQADMHSSGDVKSLKENYKEDKHEN